MTSTTAAAPAPLTRDETGGLFGQTMGGSLRLLPGSFGRQRLWCWHCSGCRSRYSGSAAVASPPLRSALPRLLPPTNDNDRRSGRRQ